MNQTKITDILKRYLINHDPLGKKYSIKDSSLFLKDEWVCNIKNIEGIKIAEDSLVLYGTFQKKQKGGTWDFYNEIFLSYNVYTRE